MSFPDKDSFNTYGGRIINGAPVVDPTTDRDAAMANQAYVSVAAMTRTATLAWVRVQLAATAGACIIMGRGQGWVYTTDPIIARTGTGDFTLTWPSTVQDEDGATHTLLFSAARVTIEGTAFAFATATPGVGNSTVRVRFSSTAGAGTPTDLVGTTVLIEAL